MRTISSTKFFVSHNFFAWLLTLSVVAVPQIACAQTTKQLFSQRITAQNAENYSETEIELHRIIKNKPKNFHAYIQLGYVFAAQRKFTQAIAAYRKAIELISQSQEPRVNYFKNEAYMGLGDAFREQGKLDEAIAAYRKVIELSQESEASSRSFFLNRAYMFLGALLKQQGKIDEAIATYRKVIELSSQSRKRRGEFGEFFENQAYIALAELFKEQGKIDLAIATYEEYIKDAGENELAYAHLGLALYERGGLPSVIARYRQFDAKTAIIAYSVFAGKLREQLPRKFADEIAVYRQISQIAPKNSDTYISIGQVLEEQGNFDEAIAAYRQAIQLKSTYAYIQLGSLLSRQKQDYERAIAVYNQAIVTYPTYITAYIELGKVLEKQQKFDLAVKTYRKAIEVVSQADGRDDIVRNLNLKIGKAFQQQKKFAQAIEYYRQAISQNKPINNTQLGNRSFSFPDSNENEINTAAYFGIGNVLEQQGKLDEAIINYQESLKIANDFWQIASNFVSFIPSSDRSFSITKCQLKTVVLPVTSSDSEIELKQASPSENGNDEVDLISSTCLDLDLADIYQTLGLALYKRGRLDAVATSSHQFKPEKASLLYSAIARELQNRHQIDEAMTAYRRSIQLQSRNPQAYFGLATLLDEQNKLTEAITTYNQLAQIKPESAFSYPDNWYNTYGNLLLGNALRRHNQIQKANTVFAQVITDLRRNELEKSYFNVYTHVNLAYALEKQNRVDEAMQVATKVTEILATQPIDTENTFYYSILGNLFNRQNKPEAAKKIFSPLITSIRQNLQTEPNNSFNYLFLGLALDGQNQHREAISAYRQFIQIVNKDSSTDGVQYLGAVHLLLGEALRKNNQLDEATAAYRQALQLPEVIAMQFLLPSTVHTLAHNGLGLTLQKQGRSADAINEFKQAIQLDASYVEAANNLKKLE